MERYCLGKSVKSGLCVLSGDLGAAPAVAALRRDRLGFGLGLTWEGQRGQQGQR